MRNSLGAGWAVVGDVKSDLSLFVMGHEFSDSDLHARPGPTATGGGWTAVFLVCRNVFPTWHITFLNRVEDRFGTTGPFSHTLSESVKFVLRTAAYRGEPSRCGPPLTMRMGTAGIGTPARSTLWRRSGCEWHGRRRREAGVQRQRIGAAQQPVQHAHAVAAPKKQRNRGTSRNATAISREISALRQHPKHHWPRAGQRRSWYGIAERALPVALGICAPGPYGCCMQSVCLDINSG